VELYLQSPNTSQRRGVELSPRTTLPLPNTSGALINTKIGTLQNQYTQCEVKAPCLTKHHAMKVYWEGGGIAPHIL
jgi:hypothetical protein